MKIHTTCINLIRTVLFLFFGMSLFSAYSICYCTSDYAQYQTVSTPHLVTLCHLVVYVTCLHWRHLLYEMDIWLKVRSCRKWKTRQSELGLCKLYVFSYTTCTSKKNSKMHHDVFFFFTCLKEILVMKYSRQRIWGNDTKTMRNHPMQHITNRFPELTAWSLMRHDLHPLLTHTTRSRWPQHKSNRIKMFIWIQGISFFSQWSLASIPLLHGCMSISSSREVVNDRKVA